MNKAQKAAYNKLVRAWQRQYTSKPGTTDVAEEMREAFLAGLTDRQVNDAMDAALLRTDGDAAGTRAAMDGYPKPSRDLRRRPR